jgi:hypothetical protein
MIEEQLEEEGIRFEAQSETQQKILFAQSPFVPIVVKLLRESMVNQRLVGDSEYETVVNAVRLDSQSDLLNSFINSIEEIKKGSIL